MTFKHILYGQIVWVIEKVLTHLTGKIWLQLRFGFWHFQCSSHKIPSATQAVLLQSKAKYTNLFHISHLLCEASVNLTHTDWRIANINVVYTRYRVMSNLPPGREEKYSFDVTASRDLLQGWWLHCVFYTYWKYWARRLTSCIPIKQKKAAWLEYVYLFVHYHQAKFKGSQWEHTHWEHVLLFSSEY